MAALFAESPNTFVTQDCAMRRPASKRSRSAWPGGVLGNSPLMVPRSRTLIFFLFADGVWLVCVSLARSDGVWLVCDRCTMSQWLQ